MKNKGSLVTMRDMTLLITQLKDAKVVNEKKKHKESGTFYFWRNVKLSGRFTD